MSSTKTAAESSGGAEVPPTNDFPPAASTRGRIGIGRIAAAYALVGLTWAIPFLASIAVLLPAKLAELPGVDKIGAFAILTIVGSIVALIANIVFGALSDRTRSRFGSRSPWIFGGAVGATLGLVILAISADFTTLLIGWLIPHITSKSNPRSGYLGNQRRLHDLTDRVARPAGSSECIPCGHQCDDRRPCRTAPPGSHFGHPWHIKHDRPGCRSDHRWHVRHSGRHGFLDNRCDPVGRCDYHPPARTRFV